MDERIQIGVDVEYFGFARTFLIVAPPLAL